jgi:hypothetical protein
MSSAKTMTLHAGGSLILAIMVGAQTSFNTDNGNALAIRTSATTTAVCSSDWAWMNNGKSQTPCVVASWVLAPCASSLTFDVTALTSNDHYDAPNTTTINACICSWSAYNLLAACTACQNFPDSIQTWGTWQMSCGGFLSNTTYFPSGFTLPSETSIPFWAGENPQTQWHDAIFNVTQAQAIGSQGHADLTGAPASTASSESSSKSPVGAIVGGVIGGLAVIFFVVVFCAYRLIKRRQRLQQNNYQNGVNRPGMEHGRSMSDSSQKYLNPNSFGMVPAGLSVVPRMMGGILPVSPSMQMLSQTGGQSAVPQIPYATPHGGFPVGNTGAHPPLPPGSPQGNMSSAGTQLFNYTMSPTSGASTYTASSQPNPEDVIVPFLSGPARSVGRKSPRGTGSPGSSHDFSEEELPPTSPPRARMNPPAYTARVGSDEVQTVAPTPGEDLPGQRKHEYGPSLESRSLGAILESENLYETAVGTGLATDGGPIDTRAMGGSRWGGSTIAGSSEREDTVMDDGDTDVKNDPLISLQGILGES